MKNWRAYCREEQQGKIRAEYGTRLLHNLAAELEPEFGSGFTVRQLERASAYYEKDLENALITNLQN